MKLTDSVTRLNFSNRIKKHLVFGGVETIEQLVRLHPWQICPKEFRECLERKIKGIGKKSLGEIVQVLADHNLKLSMTDGEIKRWREK